MQREPANMYVLAGTPGAGKSAAADRIAVLLGCTCVVEEWAPGQAMVPGALHLSNCVPGQPVRPIRIDVVELRPSDVLMVSTEQVLSSEQVKLLVDHIRSALSEVNGAKRQVLVLERGLRLQVLRPDEGMPHASVERQALSRWDLLSSPPAGVEPLPSPPRRP